MTSDPVSPVVRKRAERFVLVLEDQKYQGNGFVSLLQLLGLTIEELDREEAKWRAQDAEKSEPTSFDAGDLPPILRHLPPAPDEEALLDGFTSWTIEQGLEDSSLP